MNDTMIDEVVEHRKTMPEPLLAEVLRFIQTLSQQVTPVGVAGDQLLQFAGLFPTEELEQIKTSIEADCETIDGNEW